MNDCIITYIDKDLFEMLDNEVIIDRFENMKAHIDNCNVLNQLIYEAMNTSFFYLWLILYIDFFY